MIIAQEENIVHNAMLENNKINALLASAMECYEMVKQNRPPSGTREKIKSLQYYGESLNPHEIKRLNDESSNKDYRIATENFISKAIDSSVRVIKTIIDAIISAIKKIIEWVSSLFGGGGNSNETKNKKVENEIKEAKDKKEEKKPTNNTQTSSANNVPPTTPYVTPTEVLIKENKLGIGPDENNPYVSYHLFNFMFSGKEYIADPSSILPYFYTDKNLKWGEEEEMIANYPRICNNFIEAAKYYSNRLQPDQVKSIVRKLDSGFNQQLANVSMAIRPPDYNDYENFMKSYETKKRNSFDEKSPCFDYLDHKFKNDSNGNYFIIKPSLGIDYVGLNLNELIDKLNPDKPNSSLSDNYIINQNGNAYDQNMIDSFLKRFWSNDYTKLDDIIRKNYDEAQKIFEKSSENIQKMLDRYVDLIKKMPDKKMYDDLYNTSLTQSGSSDYEHKQRCSAATVMCLNFVFACIKQISYEMRATQKLSDQARSLGKYIANRRIQMNSETN